MGRKIDLRKVAVLAIAPDLIDKPIGMLYPNVFGNHTRLFAHSLLISLGVLGVLWRRRQVWLHPFALWCAYFGHLLLDRIWRKDSIHAFLWPFLKNRPPLPPGFLHRWLITLLMPYYFCGEILGLSILVYLFFRYRLFLRENFYLFLKTGDL